MWSNVKTMKLKKNTSGDAEAGRFADHLLHLGSGNFPIGNEPDSIFVGNFGSCVTTTL